MSQELVQRTEESIPLANMEEAMRLLGLDVDHEHIRLMSATIEKGSVIAHYTQHVSITYDGGK